MGNKNKQIQFGQMVLTDIVAIEFRIVKKQAYKKIGKTIGRSPVTVAREIKAIRTKYVKGKYDNIKKENERMNQ